MNIVERDAIPLDSLKIWKRLLLEKHLSAALGKPLDARWNTSPEFLCFLSGTRSYLWKKGYPVPSQTFETHRTLAQAYSVNTKPLSHLFSNIGWRDPVLPADITLAAWLIDPERKTYSLAELAATYLGIRTRTDADTAETVVRNTHLVARLAPVIVRKLRELGLERVWREIELPLTPVLARMERYGMRLDIEYLALLEKELKYTLDKLEKQIYSYIGAHFNIASPQQLRKILFEDLGLSTKGLRKTAGGEISVDSNALQKLLPQHPAIRLILDWREAQKILTTYVIALPAIVDPASARVHTTFLQTRTATGRLASENPNLQNIPKRGSFGTKVRQAFRAADGYQLVSFDHSQIELRIAASFSKDAAMIAAFKRGDDIHAATAAAVYNKPITEVTPDERFRAKALNFGIIYGMSARSFAESTGIPLAEARRFIEEYFRDFSGLAKFIEHLKMTARSLGYAETPTGRKRYIAELGSDAGDDHDRADRIAVNMPIQGFAADIVKLAMIRIDEMIRKNGWNGAVRMLLQVHDELLFEMKNGIIRDAVPEIVKIMENIEDLAVPIKVDVSIGDNWGTLMPFS